MEQGHHHGLILKVFVGIMIAYWLEHLVQAYQVYVFGYECHHAMGLLGQVYPWLAHREWTHLGYAILIYLGLVFLRDNFSGSGRFWWDTALLIETWHLFEHTLLLIQAPGRLTFWGATEPTSALLLFFPRIELHLFYKSVVTVPIVVAMVLQSRPSPRLAAESPTQPL
jgi:hypothetical protein